MCGGCYVNLVFNVLENVRNEKSSNEKRLLDPSFAMQTKYL